MTYEKSDENMMYWMGKDEEKVHNRETSLYAIRPGMLRTVKLRTARRQSSIIQPLPFTTT